MHRKDSVKEDTIAIEASVDLNNLLTVCLKSYKPVWLYFESLDNFDIKAKWCRAWADASSSWDHTTVTCATVKPSGFNLPRK